MGWSSGHTCFVCAHACTKVFESTIHSGVETLDEPCLVDRLVEVFESISSYDSKNSGAHTCD